MGADGPGSGVAGRLRTLERDRPRPARAGGVNHASKPAAGAECDRAIDPTQPRPALKPPVEGVHGRKRGYELGTNRAAVMARLLPEVELTVEQPADPHAMFIPPIARHWLEVGFGGGEHTLAQLTANPDVGIIGCEVFLPGVSSLLVGLDALQDPAVVRRIRVWRNDARLLLRALPDGALDRLFVLFPDPWPRTRHAKRRFVQPGLVPELARVLRPGGEWRVATDDPVYQRWIAQVLAAQEVFEGAAALPERPADWPVTRYEQKALAAGRVPMWWRLVRRAGRTAGGDQ